MEGENLITICPCGKGNNCYTSEVVDFGLCLDCGLTKINDVTEDQLEVYPQLYKDIVIGNWYPYYILTDKYTVFLDGESADKTKWVYLDLDEEGKPINSSVQVFNRYNFFDLFNLIQSKNNVE